MERRVILAVVLSFLVLWVWSIFMPKPQPPIVAPASSPEKPITSAPAPVRQEPEPEPPASSLFNFSQEKFEVTFIEPKAAIKEIIFKDYRSHRLFLKEGFFLVDKTLIFQKQSQTKEEVTFVYRDQGKQVTKRFIFHNSNYSIDLEIELQNLSNTTLKFNPPLVLGRLDFSVKNIQARFQDVTVATKEKTLHLGLNKTAMFEKIKFLSLRDRYFCAIVEPVADNYQGFINKVNLQESEVSLALKDLVLSPGQKMVQKFRIYLGPQDLQTINRIQPAWAAVINYGVFDFISQILLQALEFFYRLVHNWGWAIVILSLAIYLLLYPLTLKQMRSMKEMQVLQPRIEELRKTYKDNPQKLNKEIMELYREHKVNPLGGCLPLILQMPIFFALYQALMRAVALKGASFLWIKDLSEPDRLFILPISLPVLGNEINILPIVMTIGMFIQQKISLVSTSSGSAEQQKLMLIMMPLLFGLIFYHMPAGLVLYWFINSTLMLIYQFRISRTK